MSASHCETCGMDWKHHGTACTTGGTHGKRSLAPALCSAAASEAERELTPMEDARMMLELWDTAIRKHIAVQPRSPIHRLVKETIQRLKQPNK